MAPIEAAIDPDAATVEAPIDSIADPIESARDAIMALSLGAPRSAIEPTVRHVAATVEALFDPVAAIRPLETLGLGARITLCQRRPTRNSQRQRAGRNEMSLPHFDFSLTQTQGHTTRPTTPG